MTHLTGCADTEAVAVRASDQVARDLQLVRRRGRVANLTLTGGRGGPARLLARSS
jgi:hypothetical protein